MNLSHPSSSFAIPSVHDSTLLGCRIYHSKDHQEPKDVGAAIIAHPYAPLGGSYDDPVVGDIATALLREGYVVGLFNMRGAENSEGRTSWSAKPELADYVSFYGFMIYYVHGLGLRLNQTSTPKAGNVEGLISKAEPKTVKSTIILGGYSYGSLLVMYLPSVETVVQTFSNPRDGSSEEIIREKAGELAEEWIKTGEYGSQGRGRQRHSRGTNSATPGSLSVAFGDESTSRRTSRDSRRSLDIEGIRKSVDHVKARMHFGRPEADDNVEEGEKSDKLQVTVPSIQHLLVSPLLPPVSNFLTMFSRPVFDAPKGRHSPEVRDTVLALRPTLAIYGDCDTFTSKRKLRKWAESLTKVTSSQFEFREIKGAGHFWQRRKVQEAMQIAIRDWLQST